MGLAPKPHETAGFPGWGLRRRPPPTVFRGPWLPRPRNIVALDAENALAFTIRSEHVVVGTQSSALSASSHVLRVLAEGTSAATGDDFFRSLARHAATALGARYA